jgi:transcriptional antiterminator NusG
MAEAVAAPEHDSSIASDNEARSNSIGGKMTARWYIIHVYSNFEQKVAQSIREQAVQQGLEDMFEEVLVPTEEFVEVKRGKKVNTERKFFPGYVLVKMDLNDETWHLVRNTAKVTGFLGPNGKPAPITEEEAMRIQNQMQEGTEHPRPLITFLSGDQVRVIDGPFSSFNGVVEEVDEAKGRLKVSVSIFGRATPVELEYSQVERL